MKNKYYQPLLPENTYHVFNRAIGDEKLFRSDENYRYFLGKWFEHTMPVSDVYCYSLLPNHFHFLLRIKPEIDIAEHYYKIKKREMDFDDNKVSADFIMERISNCLNAYVKAFNVENERKGGLLMDFTKRSIIRADAYFSKMIHYIHANPVQHGCCREIWEWKHSSYRQILSSKPTRLLRDEVVDWFGSADQYQQFHQQTVKLKFQHEP